ncbi:tyrosine-type recombinase/integrase [uncultured Ilyobacter sp.]|uniref:tyrosine-type recombinase/integrase n=1 Tax=uncultured Ilyobacter sp. TaxID=544433 RepID=UPI0029C92EF1|nr:tyrosine-type recombinase/integrase [uncultured Ilyobacter sp.]
MRELLTEFIEFIKEKKGFSESSIEAYKKDLEDFTVFLMGKDYISVEDFDVMSFIENMKKEYSENSIYRKLVSLRAFYKYLYKKGLVEKIPTEGLKPVKPTIQMPETLEWEEVKRIMDQCGNHAKGKRDKLVIELLLQSGLLISEVLEIKISDLQATDYKKIKYVKNNRLHFVEMGSELSEKIRSFVEEDGKELIKDGYDFLFYGVTRQNFGARFKKYGQKAGIDQNVYPNMLRNTLAKKYLDSGIDEVKDKMHLEKLEGTGVYITRNLDKIRELYMEIAIGDK